MIAIIKLLINYDYKQSIFVEVIIPERMKKIIHMSFASFLIDGKWMIGVPAVRRAVGDSENEKSVVSVTVGERKSR